MERLKGLWSGFQAFDIDVMSKPELTFSRRSIVRPIWEMPVSHMGVTLVTKISRARCIRRVAQAGFASLPAAWLLVVPVAAAVYHVDVTATFSLAVPPFSPPFPTFSGSFDLDTVAAPIHHITFPGTFPSEDLNLTMYQEAALSAVNFNVGATTFTAADLVDLSTIYSGQPSGVLYSGRDLAPGVLSDIVLVFDNGNAGLSTGFVLCLTLSSTSCELVGEADFFGPGGALAYRSFDTMVTVTGPNTPVPEPASLPQWSLGLVALALLRWLISAQKGELSRLRQFWRHLSLTSRPVR
jgi:hypothetical protein